MSATRGSGRRGVLGVAGVLVFLGLCALSPRVVPFSMDEFVHYHALGCAAHPLQRAHPLGLEACGSYDLTPPGLAVALPLRSYLYIGSLPALTFFPFWLAGAPWVARVQGGLYFLAAGLLLARLARVRAQSALLAALVFPVFLGSFVVDVGPVGLSLVLLAGALLGMRAAILEPHGAAVRRALLAGLAVFAGLWVKLVFAWTLPALTLCALVWTLAARRAGLPARRTSTALAAFALAAALPTALLLASTDADGLPYAAVGSGAGLNLGRRLLKNAVYDVGRYFVDASSALSPVGSLPHTPLDALPALLGLGLVLFAFVRHERGGGARLWAGCALVTLLATLLSGGVWGPHHAAFGLAFLVLAMAGSVERLLGQATSAGRGAFAVLLLLLWVGVLARLPYLRPASPGTGFGKDRLLAALRHAGLARHVVLHASWGTYYIGHLFGERDQLALSIGDLERSREDLDQVRTLARSLGRGVLVVSADAVVADNPVLRQAFGAPVASRQFDEWQTVEFRP